MKPRPSTRIRSLGSYAFAEVDRKVEELKVRGAAPIDFGVGDPSIPTPDRIRRACKEGVDRYASAGYPSYVGSADFRKAVAGWTARRFGVELDPDREICSNIGAKEAVFHFAECYIDPGDMAIVPSPGYPPYVRGTHFAEGACHYLPLLRENGFLPNLRLVPPAVLSRAKILWINYPNSPSGALATDAFFEEAVGFARKHGLILASDEAYTEIYYGARPRSALEFGKENVLVFQSLSKRSAMTGYRVGWVAGDPDVVATFKKIKTNVDSGTPNFVQAAAIEALSDESHVEAMRAEYRAKRDVLVQALVGLGLPDCTPQATIYIWQKVPASMSGIEFAERLLQPDAAMVVTPGEWIADPVDKNSLNPGAGHVRLALVPSLDDCRRAADRLGKLRF